MCRGNVCGEVVSVHFLYNILHVRGSVRLWVCIGRVCVCKYIKYILEIKNKVMLTNAYYKDNNASTFILINKNIFNN